jgi:serine/alanine adding enzyme
MSVMTADPAPHPLPEAASVGRALRVREDLSDALWDAFVVEQPAACAFHYAGWPRLIGRAFDHETRMLSADDAGAVAGVLPLVIMRSRLFGRFVVSLPFLNAGGLLAADPDAARVLVDAAIAIARENQADYLELRHTARLCPALVERQHKVGMALLLQPTPEQQWGVLDRKVRNQVRKAEKHGLTVSEGGFELIEPFYDVFTRNMRDLGTPVFPLRLFQEVLRTFPGTTRVFCVYRGHQPVAGAVMHRRGDWAEVIWASALRECNPLSANVFLYWSMIRSAIRSGLRTFEFGRCTPNEGPFHFKRQWGAEPYPLVWEYWSRQGGVRRDVNQKDPKFALAASVWRRLPLAVTSTVGPRIVRGIPC